MKPHIEKKGRVLRTPVFQPTNGLVRHDLAGETLDLANRFTVSDEVLRIAVAGFGVVPSREPVIKAMVRRGRFFILVGGQSEVPFPHMGGCVTLLLEHLGQRDLPLQKVRLLVRVADPTVNARADVMATGQQRGARRRAHRATRIEIRESCALGGEAVQCRSLHRTAVAADVLPAEVI